MSTLHRYLLSAVLFLGIAALAAAQITGGIVGRVTDEGGGVLPGVTVEAKSPALQGSRTAVTEPLSNDRRSQLKLSRLYETPWKLNVGLSAYWRTARR